MKKSLSLLSLIVAFSLLVGACASGQKNLDTWPKQKRAQAHIDLGMNYLSRGDLDIARSSFKKAIDVNAQSAAAYHGLGLVEATELNLDLARQHLKRAVALDDNNSAAISDYAVVLCELGVADKAITLLRAVKSESNDDQLSLKLALARCMEADKQFVQAEQAYQAVLSLNPSIRQALLSMAQLRYDAQRYLSARAFIQRYFSTNSTSSDALLLAAKIEKELHNPGGQNDYARQLWARYPKSKQAAVARELFVQ